MNNKIFYLEPYVYVNCKKDKLLFVNTLSEKLYLFNIPNNENIKLIIDKFVKDRQISNAYINLYDKIVQDYFVKMFRYIRKSFMADYTYSNAIYNQPFGARVNYDINKNKKHADIYANSLSELFIFLDTSEDKTNKLRDFRQIQSPIVCQKITKADTIHLNRFIQKIKYLKKLVVVCNNIDIDLLQQIDLSNKNTEIVLRTFVSNINIEKLTKWKDKVQNKVSLEIIIKQSLESSILSDLSQKMYQANIMYKFIFVVEKNFNDKFLENQNYIILPYYNGHNDAFFRQNIFLTKKDIVNSKASLLSLFQKEHVNPHFWGRLNILPDGNIYSNLYSEVSLGNIAKTTPQEIVTKELYENHSWRLLRKNVMPCCDCAFQGICPHISNYELAIGKMNLCNVIIPQNTLIKK